MTLRVFKVLKIQPHALVEYSNFNIPISIQIHLKTPLLWAIPFHIMDTSHIQATLPYTCMERDKTTRCTQFRLQSDQSDEIKFDNMALNWSQLPFFITSMNKFIAINCQF